MPALIKGTDKLGGHKLWMEYNSEQNQLEPALSSHLWLFSSASCNSQNRDTLTALS